MRAPVGRKPVSVGKIGRFVYFNCPESTAALSLPARKIADPMKRTIGTALICLLGLMSALSAAGQTSGQGWTLRQCIDYARENNIQVQSSQISLQSARVDLQQAKADPDAHARIHDLAERHSSEKGERELQFRRHLLGQLRAQCRPDALQRRQAETLAAPAADRQPQQGIRGGSRPQRHRNRRHAGLSRNSVCERDGQDERPDRRVVGGPDGTVESAARSRLDRPQRLRANGSSSTAATATS